MSNPILEGLDAIKEIINSMAQPADNSAVEELRLSLSKRTKAELIEMLVASKTKDVGKEPTQRDLLCAIFKDTRCYALDYSEISECILENMTTKLKYSVNNVSWYKSKLTTEGEELVARMSTADRRKLDRQIANSVMKSL